ncbi:hypothetical protein R0J87_09190 [Halomonas sp. SIMBA_159]
MSKKDTVTANIALNSEAHRHLRFIAAKTGLTNSEILECFLLALNYEQAVSLLKPYIDNKQNKPAKEESVTQPLSPERVKEILALLKK